MIVGFTLFLAYLVALSFVSVKIVDDYLEDLMPIRFFILQVLFKTRLNVLIISIINFYFNSSSRSPW